MALFDCKLICIFFIILTQQACTTYAWRFIRKTGRIFCNAHENCTAIDPASSCINAACLCLINGQILRPNGDSCPSEEEAEDSSGVFHILIPFGCFFLAAVAVLMFAIIRMRIHNIEEEDEAEETARESTLRSRHLRPDPQIFLIEQQLERLAREENIKEDLPPEYEDAPPSYETLGFKLPS